MFELVKRGLFFAKRPVQAQAFFFEGLAYLLIIVFQLGYGFLQVIYLVFVFLGSLSFGRELDYGILQAFLQVEYAFILFFRYFGIVLAFFGDRLSQIL